MTAVSKATTYDNVNAIREDLSNIIYDISPVDTPFMSNIGRDTADNTYFEWQTDSLASADTTNAVIEGADAGDADFTATVRVANYTQISRKVVSVSGTADAVNTAGMRTLMAYETAKKAKEIKREYSPSKGGRRRTLKRGGKYCKKYGGRKSKKCGCSMFSFRETKILGLYLA